MGCAYVCNVFIYSLFLDLFNKAFSDIILSGARNQCKVTAHTFLYTTGLYYVTIKIKQNHDWLLHTEQK
jgi:hypothetical protein